MFYIVEADGTYVGGWSEEDAATEALAAGAGRKFVVIAPEAAWQKWNGTGYDAPNPAVDVPSLQDQVTALRDALVSKNVVSQVELDDVTAQIATANPKLGKS